MSFLSRSNIDRNLSSSNIDVAALDITSSDDLVLSNYDVIIGADIVYDDVLTEGIVLMLTKIFSNSQDRKVVLLSMEKRYIFTLEELDTVAPAYDFLMSR
jgi:hypothetical protein